jgi:hypothetical protein
MGVVKKYRTMYVYSCNETNEFILVGLRPCLISFPTAVGLCIGIHVR